MIDRHELDAWLRLLETPRLGRESVRKLLTAFASPQATIDAPTSAWRHVLGPARAADVDRSFPDTTKALIAATFAWLEDGSSQSRAVITLGDPFYPRALLDAADPPLLLYAQGRLDLLQRDSIAVVGSRNPTPQGSDNARAFASHLSHAGLTIVSGLALGVDAAAHAGGLEGAASTVAVVGTGLDRVYPKRNLALAHRIGSEGLLVSEYALGTPPLAPNFPLRNRIIAGLSKGTLVVEAALQSGSLITARLANEIGRDVFAIPGSIHSPQSRGCHALIRQGAKLVETAQDILEEILGPSRHAPERPVEKSEEMNDPLLDSLGYDPVTLDALAARTGIAASELNIRLLGLELEGQVARLPGQLFQRSARGG